MKAIKKKIRKGIGKLLMVLLACLMVAGVGYAKDSKEREPVTEQEPATTEPGMEMLGDQVGRAILLEDGENLEDFLSDENGEEELEEEENSNARSTIGSTCYISWGDQIQYFEWFTRMFQIQAETGSYIGYCAQPSLNPAAGAHQVYELNDDRIKAVMITNPFGPEPWDDLWYGQILCETKNQRYGIAHALIGYYYTGGTEGFYDGGEGSAYDSIFRKLPATIENWAARNQSILSKYKAYVAISSGQDIVWLERNPQGNLRLQKSSANPSITNNNSCYSLSGAEYGVYSNSGCTTKVGTLTTKADGNTNTLTLDAGTYYVKEVKAPKGYELDSKVYTVTIRENQTTTLRVTDEPDDDPIDVLLSKYDGEKTYVGSANLPQGSASLAGAEYTFKFYGTHDYTTLEELQTAERAGQISSLRTWTFATNKNGVALFDPSFLVSGDDFWYDTSGNITLPQGVLTIQETKAPEGYLLNDEMFFRKIDGIADSGNVSTYNMPKVPEQVKKGSLRIVKFGTNPDDTAGVKQPLKGVTFTLKCDDNTETFTVTTDENGEALLEDIPYGTYTVTENNAPAIYAPASPFKINVTNDGEMRTYIVENREIKAAVKIVKKDAESGNVIPIAGTKFRLLDSNKNPVSMTVRYPHTQELSVFETDEQGTFTFPERLNVGNYYLEEVQAPEGYLKGELLEFQITKGYDWDTPLVIEYTDKEVKGQIKLLKVNTEDGEPLENAEFTITAAEDIVAGDGTLQLKKGETAEIIVTDSDGKAESTELYLGRYEVRETKAPEGFVLDQTVYGVDLSYIDQETELIIKDLGAIENIPTEIVLTKKKEGTDETLEGVTFAIGEKGTDDKSEYVTDEHGQINVKYLKSGTTYCVQEVKTLPGYVPGKEIIEIEVDETGLINGEACYAFTVENDYTRILGTTATDQDSGQHEGVTRTETVIVDVVHIEGLVPGEEYVLKGVQMLTEQEEPLLIDDKEIWGETTFVATSYAQDVEVEFFFDSSGLGDTKLTTYEYLYTQDVLIGSHEEITDEDQTVYYPEVLITTNVFDMDSNTHQAVPKKKSTSIDVVHIEGLVQGEEYVLKGMQMLKKEEKPYVVGEEEVVGETVFVAEDSQMDVEVEFHFDSSELNGKSLVTYQYLHYKEELIEAHDDINNMDQTILYKMGKIKTSVPDNFREGQNTSGKIKTGDSQNALIWVMVLIGALICVSVCLMRYRNKEAKKDER